MDVHIGQHEPPAGYRLLNDGEKITARSVYWSLSRGRWWPAEHTIGFRFSRRALSQVAAPVERAYCQVCRRELVTESGQVCAACANSPRPAAAPKPSDQE
jgi:hypothetical protein